MAELHARIRVALRRAAGAGRRRRRRRSERLDRARSTRPRGHASTAGRSSSTPREFEILRVLLANPGRLVTRGRLLRAVWGEAYQGEDHYVHVHVSQLRRKLAAADPTGEAGRSDRHRARRRLSDPGAGAGSTDLRRA